MCGCVTSFPPASPQSPTGFDQVIAHAQQTLDLLPNPAVLVIDPAAQAGLHWQCRNSATAHGTCAVYPAGSGQGTAGGRGDGFLSLDDIESLQDQLLRRYEQLYGRDSGRVDTLRRKWETGFPRDSVRSHFANITRKIEAAVPIDYKRPFTR